MKNSDTCILNDGLKILSKKWTVLIFCHLLNQETLTFNELLRLLTDRCGNNITSSVLSQTLKELEDFGVLNKKILTDFTPIRTEYQLTNKGKEMRLIYAIIKEWVLKWFDEEKFSPTKKLNCLILDSLPEIKNQTDFFLNLSVSSSSEQN